MLTIEFEPSKEGAPCKCCGGRTTSLVRFVYSDGDAYAIYYAMFSGNHPDRIVVATVSLGEWGEHTTPEQRVAFAMELRSTENEYQVSLIDSDQSPWRDSRVIGRTLDREEALTHPWVKDAFHVAEHMAAEDGSIRSHLNGS
jgi:hypothetical protein